MTLRIALSTALSATLLITSAVESWGICRIVEEAGSPPPVMTADQSVLLVKYSDAVIGSNCGSGPNLDGGPSLDGGSPGSDAGSEPIPDASLGDTGDAGLESGDAGLESGDAGPGFGDAGPDECEEIRGEAITMVVQPEFSIAKEGARFALLMVTPSWPIVTVADNEIFHDLAEATAPQVLVEEQYIEDVNLGYQCQDPHFSSGCGPAASSGGNGGGGWQPPPSTPPDFPTDPAIDAIGAYEVVRLNVGDSEELAGWLEEFNYLYSEADLQATTPYIEEGWTVVAVRVRHDFGHHGGLTPLAFSWAGTEMRLPVGISTAPAPSESHLTLYVSAEQRYDLDDAFVPYANPSEFGSRSYLTRNDTWLDLSLGADSDPYVRASSLGDTHDTVTVEQIVRIPSSDCPSSGDDEDWGCGCSVKNAPGPGSVVVFLLCGLALLRRRRRG